MLGFTLNPQKRFAELGEREILALAITLEEEDGRIYRDFAEGLREGYPATAKVFDDMAEEESGHRRMLIDLYRERFGEHIPLVRREDVRGFVRRKPIWLTKPLGVGGGAPAGRGAGAGDRQLLPRGRQAGDRRQHQEAPGRPGRDRGRPRPHRAPARGALSHRIRRARARPRSRIAPSCCSMCSRGSPGSWTARSRRWRRCSPRRSRPGGAGTRSWWDAAASIGAGISMGFAEALSDDGSITGRGRPWLRGFVCGLMTTLGGARPYTAVPDPQLSPRHHAGRRRGPGGAVGDRLGARALHGHAVPAGGVPGRARRRPGVRDRDPDRQRMSRSRGSCSCVSSCARPGCVHPGSTRPCPPGRRTRSTPRAQPHGPARRRLRRRASPAASP